MPSLSIRDIRFCVHEEKETVVMFFFKGIRCLTLDFGLDIVDCVRRLHLKGDGFAREGLDENLHFGLNGVQSADM